MSETKTKEPSWRANEDHRRWLRREADLLFAFFEEESLDPAGGFHSIDDSGKAIRENRRARCTPRRGWFIVSRSAICWGGQARPISSITA